MEKLNKLRKKYYIVLGILIAIEVIISIFVFSIGIEGFYIFMFTVTLLIILLIVLYNEMVKKPFKLEFVSQILKEYKSSIEYTFKIDGEDYKKFIKNFKLIPSATSFKFTDVIDDDINGIRYRSMDLHATHTQSTGKSSTTVTDFKGKVYVINMENPYCNYILKEEKWKRIPNGYEFLDLESIDFNSKFNLYVTDTHEAHKIFTPSRILNLVELEKKYYNVMTVVHLKGLLYILSYDKEDQFEDMDDPKESIIADYKKQYDFLKNYLEVVGIEK